MEEENPEAAVGPRFPTPPFFWQSFTPENIARIDELREAQQALESKSSSPSRSSNLAAPIRLLDLPSELRYLQPPEPPLDGRYRCFGEICNLDIVTPSLEEAGITQLYSPADTPTGSGNHADRAFILKRIAKSLLLNFLELVGLMSVNPEQWMEKFQDLQALFFNFHHLLNEYRPHQARESLILMMQDQLERSKAETEGILKMKSEVEGVLEGLGKGPLAETDINGSKKAVEIPVEEELDVWEELGREFD